MVWISNSWGHCYPKRQTNFYADPHKWGVFDRGHTSVVEEFRTLWWAFPKVHWRHPNERLDIILGHHLYYTHIPIHEKMNHETWPSNDFCITIQYDTKFKNMSKGEAWSACFNRLHNMNIPLGSEYSSPINIGLNQVTKNWTCFLKLHLNYPLKDGLALLRGECAFVMELEGERVIGKAWKYLY